MTATATVKKLTYAQLCESIRKATRTDQMYSLELQAREFPKEYGMIMKHIARRIQNIVNKHNQPLKMHRA